MAETQQGPANEQKPTVGLTQDAAEILLKADIRNLTQKVAAGKTLTAHERNMLLSVQSGGKAAAVNYAANQVELAAILNVSRKTIQRARKKPGNPGVRPDNRWDVAAWREFLRQTGNCIEDDEEDYAVDKARQAARRVYLQNENLEADLAIKRKEWMPVDEVEKLGADLAAAIKKVVLTLHLCAPSVVGLSVAEAEDRLREVEQEILEQFHVIDQSLAAMRMSDAPAT